ncbi:hypothetical protein [Micromonospora sp. NPDC007230]
MRRSTGRWATSLMTPMREHRDAVRAARGEPARRAAGADPAAAGSPAD